MICIHVVLNYGPHTATTSVVAAASSHLFAISRIAVTTATAKALPCV